MGKFKDLSGTVCGRLTVKYRIANTRDVYGKSQINYFCECSCGGTKELSTRQIISGYVNSCGCLRKETSANSLKNYRKEGGLPWNKLSDDQAAINRIFTQYQKDATKRGHFFDLSKEKFTELITQSCYYCGSPPDGYYSVRSFKVGGVDRLNSDQGYTESNVVPCCSVCNKMKSNMALDSFVEHIFKLFEHLNLTKEGYKNGS